MKRSLRCLDVFTCCCEVLSSPRAVGGQHGHKFGRRRRRVKLILKVWGDIYWKSQTGLNLSDVEVKGQVFWKSCQCCNSRRKSPRTFEWAVSVRRLRGVISIFVCWNRPDCQKETIKTLGWTFRLEFIADRLSLSPVVANNAGWSWEKRSVVKRATGLFMLLNISVLEAHVRQTFSAIQRMILFHSMMRHHFLWQIFRYSQRALCPPELSI